MRVPLRHHAGLVSQQALHLVQIDAALHEACRKGVPKAVETEYGYARPLQSAR